MTAPVYDRWGVTVYHGDNLDVLREMPDCSVDSVVTDPPAGIAFMGKAWDTDRGGRREWVSWLTERMTETLRVLKPGGHALVWSMPRTSHWTGWALEDAGFEVRDVVQHAYEGGYPKSLDVAKAFDRRRSSPDEIREVTAWVRDRCRELSLGSRELDAACGTNGMGGHWTTQGGQAAIPTVEQWRLLEPVLGTPPDWMAERIRPARSLGDAWGQREVVGQGYRVDRMDGAAPITRGSAGVYDITTPSGVRARQWQGWGTALRPAAEPWWSARKPLGPGRSVTDSLVMHGTGAINIDACRGPDGQWPANVAKFPKAPPSERPMVNGEQHPTVKSVALCRWLVRLVTPPSGTVLDLFAGTGTVGQAARAEGFKAVLIEQDEQSIGFIRARLDGRAKTEAGAASDDGEPMDLLDLLGGDAS